MGNFITNFQNAKNAGGEQFTNMDIVNLICSQVDGLQGYTFDSDMKISHANLPIAEFEAHRNGIYAILIDVLATTVAKSLVYENPLGIFRKENIDYGLTVREIAVGLPDEQAYDAKSNISPHRFVDTDLKVYYHNAKREALYERTFNKSWLKEAFSNENSFDQMIDAMFKSFLSADEVDEFQYIKDLVTQMLAPVNVGTSTTPDIKYNKVTVVDPTDVDFIINLNSSIKKRSNYFAIPSRTRTENLAGFTNVTPLSDQYLLIDVDVSELFDSLYANAYNVDFVKQFANKILVDEFNTYNGTGDYTNHRIIAALISRDTIILHDTDVEFTSQKNARALTINYFYHHHEIVSYSIVENLHLWVVDESAIPAGTSLSEHAMALLKDKNKEQ